MRGLNTIDNKKNPMPERPIFLAAMSPTNTLKKSQSGNNNNAGPISAPTVRVDMPIATNSSEESDKNQFLSVLI